MDKTELDQSLFEYGKSDFYPFHMPGHKRRFCPETLKNPYLVDITEIDGFDNLHHPEGILLESQRRASRLYGAAESYYLVNGSTAGILSALSAAVTRGGTVLMARNCHKAAYHGAYLRNLKVRYLYPSREKSVGLNGGISARQAEEMLARYPEAEAVFLTSPTYDGVVSDVEEIAKAVHARNIPLIVDEAHGAHFAFSDYFPVSALDLGADVVIQSLHKTLPSMTQTALLHRNSGRVSGDLLRRFLGIYQSSSPSYVFMAGIETCVRWVREEGKAAFEEYVERLDRFRREMAELSHLHLFSQEDAQGQGDIFALDKSKLIITTAGTDIDGKKLSEILMGSYHIQMEMSAPGYALALSSVMDTEEGFSRLKEALFQIDSRLHGKSKITGWKMGQQEVSPLCTIAEGMDSPWEEISLDTSQGRVSAEFISLYPPGIPCLVPGEQITEKLLEDIEEWKQMGLDIQGPNDYTLEKIRVLKDCGYLRKTFDIQTNIELSKKEDIHMGRIYYIMGKSSSGKDTIYSRLLADKELSLQNIILYTTRPVRQGETEGREYHFVSRERFQELEKSGKVIESRTYETVHGPWTYFTADDGQVDLEKKNYLAIGTLESYSDMKKYYGGEALCPVYVEVEDGERLRRAIAREEAQENPRYAEMCRRFLADTEDFSEEKLAQAGITRRFQNTELEYAIREIKEYIRTGVAGLGTPVL